LSHCFIFIRVPAGTLQLNRPATRASFQNCCGNWLWLQFLATAAGDVALLMVILLCGLGLRNRKRPAIVAAVIENYTRGAAQHQGIPTHSITSNLY